jgi:hypothetical protein
VTLLGADAPASIALRVFSRRFGTVDELEGICKEAVVVYSRYCHAIYVEGLKINNKSLGTVDVPAGIQTENLPNISLGRYRYNVVTFW